MTRINCSNLLLALTFAAGTTAFAAQQPQTMPQTTPKPAPAAVTLIGCVERAAADPTSGRQTQAALPAAYKLIDAQAGGSSPVVDVRGGRATPPPPPPSTPPRPTMVVEHQYWMTAPASIDLSKYQNQRVEVIGTIGSVGQLGGRGKDATGQPVAGTQPMSMLTITSLKVLSTECK
jgi:hypothetical protein